MIITTEELLASGLPISDEIDEAKLERAIETIEQYIVKPRLGDQMFHNMIGNPTEFQNELNGGYVVEGDKCAYLTGLKTAEYHLAFAELINMDIAATSFGSNVKLNPDVSRPTNTEELRRVGMTHTEIGLRFIKEITDWHKIDNSKKNLPNILWSEFL